MSRSHRYSQANAANSPTDLSESDGIVSPEELTPETDGYGSQRHGGSGSYRNKDQIPLQDLRHDQARSYTSRDAGLGHQDPEAGTRLLDENTETDDPTESFTSHADDARLLPKTRTPQPSAKNTGGLFHRGPSRSEDARSIVIGQHPAPRFPPNAVSNAKYTAWSFLPRSLYNEFSFFFNMYFLLVALSQIMPSLRIGYLSTYIAPLAFVLAITLGKEALDDIARRRRDAEANKEQYTVLHLSDQEPTQREKSRTKKGHSHSGNSTSRKGVKYSRLDAIKEEEETLSNDHDGIGKSSIIVTEVNVRSRDLKVGDVVKLGKNQRVPADLVILKSYSADTSATAPPAAATPIRDSEVSAPTNNAPGIQGNPSQELQDPPCSSDTADSGLSPESSESGEAFIRTDQLDGETDWKLRLASPLTQLLDPREFTRLRIVAGKPDRRVNEFVGTLEYFPAAVHEGSVSAVGGQAKTSPLTIDNTAWANTVLASNATVLAVVVYTGAQTRQALSTSPSRSKSGLLEYEINNLTKILCALTLMLSVVLVAVRGAEGRPGQKWYVAVLRFLVLFSTIVPISLRVNLDMGKTVYARFIERDRGIPDTVVRTSTIPEELGRIEYLLSDKTGTLTQNEMDLRKIHVGTVSYAHEAMDEVRSYIKQMLSAGSAADVFQGAALVTPSSSYQTGPGGTSSTRGRREIGSRVRDLVIALALCHNVTPSSEEIGGHQVTTYQASSPDEIAIVHWAESVGLRLLHRDRKSITLQSVDTARVAVRVRILDVFPFTSTSKRMGIVVQFFHGVDSTESTREIADEIWFYEKGADTVMGSIVAANDWLDEETANMAREGLRTLVVGRKRLSAQQYEDFASRYKKASLSLQDRDSSMSRVVGSCLEHNLELLGVTGVEDRLQKDVKPSLELLRNAGIKIWMLTGDKVETARCVAVSSKLVSRAQHIHTITQLSASPDASAAADALSLLRSKPHSTALLIDGESLSHFLAHNKDDFISLAVHLPAVIACRCSPTQKAEIAHLIRQFTKKRVACIGDGGNDVSMIQAADVGVGIVGKEGRQASLAADFSITSFHHLTKLLVWHGRNSYKRSAKLAQFVIHRGLIISVCQTFYSIATELQPHALYRDWLLVGYATVYTMAPVFSLVLDKDVDEGLANLYPELYKELTLGKSLSYRTFFVWVAVSIYQGGIIQGCSQLLVDRDSDRMVSVSFTVLLINELIMVAFEVVTWHWIMYVSILGTALIYVGSIPFLGGYFDLGYMWSWPFAWRVAAVSALSLIPPYCIKLLRRTLKPPSYRKVQGL